MLYQPLMLVKDGAPQEGRWHMTVQSGSNDPTKHACCRACKCSESGHPTSDQALACFNLYESRQTSFFDTGVRNQFGKCLECEAMTGSMVQAGAVFMKNLRLCNLHRDQETISRHFLADEAR